MSESIDHKGHPPRIPAEVAGILSASERILAVLKQSRLKATFTPDSIVVTDQRIIRYSPSFFSLTQEIEDYRYVHIANLKIDKGVFWAKITVKRRFMSEDLILENLPNKQAEYFCRIIQENLENLNNQQSSQGSNLYLSEDPLQVLKLRFAKGEISKEEFEEMKNILE